MSISGSPNERQGALSTYFLLTFGITWLCWIPVLIIAANGGYDLPTIDRLVSAKAFVLGDFSHVMLTVVFSFAVFGPLLGAIGATMAAGKRESFKKLLYKIVHWRVSVRWYLVTVVLALAMPLLPLLISLALGVVTPRAGSSVSFLPFMGLLLYQIVTSGLGEEPGWRGFLLPTLFQKYGTERAIWLCGLSWAIWHYPFTAYTVINSMDGLEGVAIAAVVIPALAGQTMSLIGMTYIYAWLYTGTNSVLLCILFHALGNVANAYVFAFVGNSQALTLAVAVMPWAVVLVLQRVYRPAGSMAQTSKSIFGD